MLCSLSCSRASKLLDLKADSSGGPNRLSEPDAVELNLMRDKEGKRQKIRESRGVIEGAVMRRRNKGKEGENGGVGVSERRGNWGMGTK